MRTEKEETYDYGVIDRTNWYLLYELCSAYDV